MDRPVTKKRPVAANELEPAARTPRPLAASRWAPALPTFALALAALSGCGQQEEARTEPAHLATPRSSEAVRDPASTAAGTIEEPTMGALTATVATAASLSSSASSAPLVPPTSKMRTAGGAQPIVTAPPVTIAPSPHPPTPRGKPPPVRPAPIGSRSIDDPPVAH